MALETLKDVLKIGGFEVEHTLAGDFWEPNTDLPIHVDYTRNEITFKIQKGPIKEMGLNGCQVDTIIMAAKMIILGLNEKFPCRHNAETLDHLSKALLSLENRKADRETRGVEGHNKL